MYRSCIPLYNNFYKVIIYLNIYLYFNAIFKYISLNYIIYLLCLLPLFYNNNYNKFISYSLDGKIFDFINLDIPTIYSIIVYLSTPNINNIPIILWYPDTVISLIFMSYKHYFIKNNFYTLSINLSSSPFKIICIFLSFYKFIIISLIYWRPITYTLLLHSIW